jgi:hypothetical protein
LEVYLKPQARVARRFGAKDDSEHGLQLSYRQPACNQRILIKQSRERSILPLGWTTSVQRGDGQRSTL